MEIPSNVITFDMRSSTIWFDEDGIMYSKPKPDAPTTSTDQEIIEDVEKLRKLTGGKKVCMVLQSAPNSAAPPKEQRDLIDKELHSVVKAMAIITTSAVSKMIVNLFFAFRPASYPVKMFTDVKEAVKWIKETSKKLDSEGNSSRSLLVA